MKTSSPHRSAALALGLILGIATPVWAAAGQPDMRSFIAEVDRNKDGCVSHDEWFGPGLPKSAYDMLKDAKGCVTLKAITDTAAPPGIDLNGDGKVTLAEFLEFDRRGPPAGAASGPVPAR